MTKQIVLDMVPFIGKENKARKIITKKLDSETGRKCGEVRAGHAPTGGG